MKVLLSAASVAMATFRFVDASADELEIVSLDSAAGRQIKEESTVMRLVTFVICGVFAAMSSAAFNPALANGNKDADKDKAEQKVITVQMALGSENDKKRLFHPHNLTFQKGKRYRLVIHNPSLDVHEFDSPGLVGAVWSSHVKVFDGYGEGAQAVAIVVGTPAEIEILPGASIEWEFVPVAAGRYEMICDTKDQNGKTHTAQGMTGTILVQ